MRKQMLDAQIPRTGRRLPGNGEIDCAEHATIGYSSEDPDHPVEHLFDGSSGPGATRWLGARADETESIVLQFDRPQSISRIVYEVEETERSRTQEVRIEVSVDDEQTYAQLLVQQYTFSPAGATYQREDLRFNIQQATHLKLTVVPDKDGSGRATLTSLRLFA